MKLSSASGDFIIWSRGEGSSRQVSAEVGTVYEQSDADAGEDSVLHYIYRLPQEQQHHHHQQQQQRRVLRVNLRGDVSRASARTRDRVVSLIDSAATRNVSSSRTLCLGGDETTLVVTLEEPKAFGMEVLPVQDFQVSTGDSGTVEGVTSAGPELKYLDFGGFATEFGDRHFIRLTVTSEEEYVCGRVTIIPAEEGGGRCPPFQRQQQRLKGSVHQTMLGFSSFLLDSEEFSSNGGGGAFAFFSLTRDDSDCIAELGPPASNRTKSFHFQLEEASFEHELYLEIGLAVAFLCLLFIMALVATCAHATRVDDIREELDRIARDSSSFSLGDDGSGAIASPSVSMHSSRTASTVLTSTSPDAIQIAVSPDGSREERRFFLELPDSPRAAAEQEVFQVVVQEEKDGDEKKEKRVKKKAKPKFLSDLPNQNRQYDDNSMFYMWTVLIVGLFYGVPAFQVVISHQRELSNSGDQDLCYYNHLCAVPVSPSLRDFNHVFSNIWYLGLGSLFAWLVHRRQTGHERLLKEVERRLGPEAAEAAANLGVPRRRGVFYAVAAATFLQGVLSACYHICPTEANFQFDTTFMHVIGSLLFVKVHQFRHSDSDAAWVFLGLGAALCLEVAGIAVGGDSVAFWVVALVGYLALSLVFTASVVYHPDVEVPRAILSLFRSAAAAVGLSPRPDYYSRRRLSLASAMNVLNLCLMAYGALARPGVSIYLLAVMVCNLGAYCLHYAVMKFSFGEAFTRSVALYFALSLLTWGGAFYFYASVDYAIELSPAQSRDLNSECLALGLFDAHDIWHVLSAAGLFCCYMLLFTLDDGVALVPRNKLRAF